MRCTLNPNIKMIRKGKRIQTSEEKRTVTSTPGHKALNFLGAKESLGIGSPSSEAVQ
jgi:hypothetical protein